MSHHRLIRALLRQPVDRTPIWIMRQAGRYLPEYRQLRQQAKSFMNLCTTPELACAATLQPLARYKLDAAILFSDILTIPAAMGLGLSFIEGEGPKFARPLRCKQDIAALGVPDPETDLGYVMDAVRLIRKELADRVPLIGFAGSPWTLACYMIEGGSSRNFDIIKAMLYQDPISLHKLLALLTKAVIEYLKAQIAAGVQIIMLFDTWGGILTPLHFQQFSLAYIAEIFAELNKTVDAPKIIFTKGGGQWLNEIADVGCDAVGIDWMTDIAWARQQVGHKVAIQGNLEPQALFAAPEVIRAQVASVLENYGRGEGHIFNLGHGILPGTPPEHVEVLIDAVHKISMQYHTSNI
ncbi:uroporphyrinogen decarboxylase [soil metagenome]